MFFLLAAALLLRLYGINWDQGFHLHPDERMLIMVADGLHFFDALNPHFFNYGTLPIYILKAVTQLADTIFNTNLSHYDGMLLAGRLISTAADLGTTILVYISAQKLLGKKSAALCAAFIYAFVFFTIQNSHFFVVDVFLTFFVTAAFYFLLLYTGKPALKYIVLSAAALAAALATKFTAILFFPVMLLAIGLPWHRTWRANWRQILTHIMFFAGLALVFSFVFFPYAYLSWKDFIADVSQQTRMSRNPYIFPYTLQYVGTLPYFYYLKNIFLWGMGPAASVLSIFGFYGIIIRRTPHTPDKSGKILALLFYAPYFAVVGFSAVKFMRYMLPLYPVLAVAAGYGLYTLRARLGKPVFYMAVFLVMAWTAFFVNIYSYPHTRIAATDWILKNIPPGSVIAVEHWDDRLPLVGADRYAFTELTLYDQPDNQPKWAVINQKLAASDYIVLASNRLYVPLQKLSDCRKYLYCFPQTAKYYKKLFAGQLGFTKVYEAEVNPSIKLFGRNFGINDQSADESFTVYDHPKIMIFKKSGQFKGIF